MAFAHDETGRKVRSAALPYAIAAPGLYSESRGAGGRSAGSVRSARAGLTGDRHDTGASAANAASRDVPCRALRTCGQVPKQMPGPGGHTPIVAAHLPPEENAPVETVTDCPTFVDLAALARSDAPAGGSDPFGADARRLDVRAGPCDLLVIALDAGTGDNAGLDGDLFVFAQNGAVTLTGPEGDVALAQGQAAVIARGTAFGWRCDAPATLIAMAYPEGDAAPAGITAIDNDAAMKPSNPPAANLLLGETPSCRSNNHFTSADGTFVAGIWDSTPYQRTPIFFHHTELMHLLAGTVTFTDASGRTATFGKGDTFIIEKGAECSWDSREDVAKIYATYRPAA